MSVLNNKFIGALVVLNLAILLAVVWLVGALTGFKMNQSSTEAAVTAVMQKRGLITDVAETSADSRTHNPAVTSTLTKPTPTQPRQFIPTDDPSPSDSSDGAIVRHNEIDPHGNLHILISNAMHEKESVTTGDAAYLASLDALSQTSPATARPTPTISKQAAVLHEIRKKNGSSSIDRYNKVNVNTPQHSTSLADQIQNLVNQAIETKPGNARSAYLQSLENASQERINESRTVTVRTGDTLWTLAIRAYDDGFQYPRIFKANPHLLSPDQIEVGEVLRVPL